MDLITLIILIIVCGIGILLVFRAIAFVLRIVSIVILLIAILSVAGSYFMAQAYVLPIAHTSFVTLTADGGFVISQTEATQLELDSAATAAYAITFIKPIRALNVSTYQKLKTFAKTDIFATQDTVWVVNAIDKKDCTEEKIIDEPESFTTACLDNSLKAKTSSAGIIEQLKAIVNVSALNRVPIKASFWQWLKNYYLF